MNLTLKKKRLAAIMKPVLGFNNVSGTWSYNPATGILTNTPITGVELLTNNEFTADTSGWAGGNGTISRVDSTSDPGTNSGGIDKYALKYVDGSSTTAASQNITASANQWYALQARAYAPSTNTQVKAARLFLNNSALGLRAQVTAEDAWQTLFLTDRAIASTTAFFCSGTASGGSFTTGDISYFDAVGFKLISTPTIFFTKNYGFTTCTIRIAIANVSALVGVQYGGIARLDSQTNPLNYYTFYRGGDGKVYAEKIINGTPTAIITAGTAAYVQNATVDFVEDATTVKIYYNNVQVGLTYTKVGGDPSGAYFGYFSTNSSAQLKPALSSFTGS